MNRLHFYIAAIIVSIIASILNLFGDYTFTFMETAFFVSSLLMVFSFEKKPTKDIEKPQIHSYIANRLNFTNYLGALNIAVFVTSYLLLKFIDPYRALLYLHIVWAAAAFGFKKLYDYSAKERFKHNLIDYLLLVKEKDSNLNHVAESKIIEFVEIMLVSNEANPDKFVTNAARALELKQVDIEGLYSLSVEYIELNTDQIKSSELP